MKNLYKLGFIVLLTGVFYFSCGAIVLAQVGGASVQTNSATSITNYQATLNGYLSVPYISSSNYVYFQYGPSVNYGSQTPSQYLGSGSFSQIITGLSLNSTYHFMAVAQGSFGTVYGQDMTFYTGQSNGSSLTANAGPDLYLTAGQTATLQGSGYDQSGNILNYYWSCTGGALSSTNIAQPIYTAPYTTNYSNQTNYTCTLTITNNYGLSNSDSATIYVNYNGSGNVYNSNAVQTNSATNISSYQATLNGYLSGANNYGPANVYFQWGPTINYGSQTNQQYLNSGAFSQVVSNFNSNTTYHFRAVVQGNSGPVYGQDMSFYSSINGTGPGNYYGNGILSATKKVINLTSGNLNWASSVSANPSDVLSFAIILQAGGQDIHNVVVRDVLPANLIYRGNLAVNTNTNYGGDIMSGVNVGTVYANQPIVVSYQAQVAPAGNFSYGTATLNNNATITSNEAGTQTASATVVISRTLVQGASTVSTGLTNNFLTDSFLLPLLIIIAGLWLYFSGSLNQSAGWLKSKR